MRREPGFWTRIVVEAALIVFSVLLALFLNARWANSREQETSRQQLTSIRAELEGNRKIVGQWLEVHGQIAERLASLRAAGDAREPLVVDHMLQFDRVLGQSVAESMLRDTAWKAAQATGVVRTFEPAQVNLLSDIYELQRQGPMRSIDRIAELLFAREAHDASQIEQTLVLLELSFGELLAQEHLLVGAYDRVISKLAAAAPE